MKTRPGSAIGTILTKNRKSPTEIIQMIDGVDGERFVRSGVLSVSQKVSSSHVDTRSGEELGGLWG